MTSNQWKLYGPEETLQLYKRAEYKANMEENKAESYKTKNAAAKDNLEEARSYLKQAENTLVKLKTELTNINNNKDARANKTKMQNDLYKEGKDELNHKEAIKKAEAKVQEAAAAKKDAEEQAAVAAAAAEAANIAEAKKE